MCCCYPFTKLHPTLCDPMDCSTPGSSVLHYLQEFVQIHVYRVGDAISNHLILCPSFSFCPQSFPASIESIPHKVAKVITKVILYIHIYMYLFLKLEYN